MYIYFYGCFSSIGLRIGRQGIGFGQCFGGRFGVGRGVGSAV